MLYYIRCAYDRILIPCIKLIKNRYASLPKINLYKRKRLPQRKVEESDDIFYYTPAAYENSTGPVFLNHPSKYNTKRLKTPRGKKVCKTQYHWFIFKTNSIYYSITLWYIFIFPV